MIDMLLAHMTHCMQYLCICIRYRVCILIEFVFLFLLTTCPLCWLWTFMVGRLPVYYNIANCMFTIVFVFVFIISFWLTTRPLYWLWSHMIDSLPVHFDKLRVYLCHPSINSYHVMGQGALYEIAHISESKHSRTTCIWSRYRSLAFDIPSSSAGKDWF